MTSQKTCIQNLEYYNDSLNENLITIFTKYNSLMVEYLKYCYDNIYIQNIEYQKYIIKQGISTIKHVFKMLLIYTKNLEMTFYNCHKSYIYFIEFIGQISEDNHSFLQLNSKDASLFVYKKTIFEINNDVVKNYKSDDNIKSILSSIDILIDLYNNILFKLIDNNDLNSIIKIVNIDLQKIIQKIVKIYMENNNINILHNFNNHINHCNTNIIDSLELLIKQLKKKDNMSNFINNLNNNLINI